MKINKKVFADSAVLTTAMLKKCVRVPIRYVKNPDDPDCIYNRDADAITAA
jgi:predicted alpha/beta hydrolase